MKTTEPARAAKVWTSARFVWAILVMIQGENNPVYRAVQRHIAPGGVLWLRARAFVFPILIVVLGTLQIIEIQTSGALYAVRDQALTLLLGSATVIVNLGWTLPATLFAGQSIGHARSKGIWDVLVLGAPSHDETIQAHIAASVRPVWGLIVAMLILSVIAALSLAVLYLWAIESEIAAIVRAITAVLAIVLVCVERIQETALALLIGMRIGLKSGAGPMPALLAFAWGVTLRIGPTLLVLAVLPPRWSIQWPIPDVEVGLTFALAAFAAPLIFLQHWEGLIILAALFIGREIAVRHLYRHQTEL